MHVFPCHSSPVSQVSSLHRTASRRLQRATPARRAVPGKQRPAGGWPVATWKRAPRQPAAVWAAWRPQRWRGPRRLCRRAAASLTRECGGAPGRPVVWGKPAGPGSQPGSGWSNGGSQVPHCPPSPWWCEQCPPERGCALMCLWRPWWSHPSCHPGNVRRRKTKKILSTFIFSFLDSHWTWKLFQFIFLRSLRRREWGYTRQVSPLTTSKAETVTGFMVTCGLLYTAHNNPLGNYNFSNDNVITVTSNTVLPHPVKTIWFLSSETRRPPSERLIQFVPSTNSFSERMEIEQRECHNHNCISKTAVSKTSVLEYSLVSLYSI